jgi:hypothetical protein
MDNLSNTVALTTGLEWRQRIHDTVQFLVEPGTSHDDHPYSHH